MPNHVYQSGGAYVFECAADGPLLRTDRDAVDVISAARSAGATLAVIPVARLDADLFSLKTRLAGEFLQKFVTYGVRVVILGEISAEFLESRPLSDFVRECNRGRDIWFVKSRKELTERLARCPGSS